MYDWSGVVRTVGFGSDDACWHGCRAPQFFSWHAPGAQGTTAFDPIVCEEGGEVRGDFARFARAEDQGRRVTRCRNRASSWPIDRLFDRRESYETNGPIPVTYKQLHRDVKKGERILLDDGFLEVQVTRVTGRVIHTKVLHDGLLKSRKGMNLPDSMVKVDPFTEKDHNDLLFGIENNVDWLVLSFISKPEIAEHVRRVAASTARAQAFVRRGLWRKLRRNSAWSD